MNSYDKANKLRIDGNFSLRSCWNCNDCHNYLKERKGLIHCFLCGHWFLDGECLTDKKEKGASQT